MSRPSDSLLAADSGVAIYRWPPEPGADERARAEPLADRLAELVDERTTSGAELVRATAGVVLEWWEGRPAALAADALGATLEEGLAEWERVQGWRGTCAVWLDALRSAFRAAFADGEEPGRARALVREELRAWAEPGDERAEAWDGAPFASGRRLPARRELVPYALRAMERGERALVHGWSETVARVLEEAQRAGLAPEVLLTEAGPDFGGRRMAQRLARAGCRVELTYDLAAVGQVRDVDRVWIGAEAIGAGAFLGRVGTRLLLAEAEREEVPSAVLATSDKLVPGGALRLPPWGGEDWLMWGEAPPGVTLAAQPFERVPLDAVREWITEQGPERPAELFVRALRSEPAAPCGR